MGPSPPRPSMWSLRIFSRNKQDKTRQAASRLAGEDRNETTRTTEEGTERNRTKPNRTEPIVFVAVGLLDNKTIVNDGTDCLPCHAMPWQAMASPTTTTYQVVRTISLCSEPMPQGLLFRFVSDRIGSIAPIHRGRSPAGSVFRDDNIHVLYKIKL